MTSSLEYLLLRKMKEEIDKTSLKYLKHCLKS